MGNRNIKGIVIGTCEACRKEGYIELHHIKPVSLGGSDNKDNLINLCCYCHELIHKLGIYNNTDIKNIKINGIERYLYTEYCIESNASNKFIKEYGQQQLEFGRFILNMLSEKSNKSELIKQGLIVACEKGKTLGRPKAELPTDFIKEYKKFKDGGYGDMSAVAFAKMLGIGRSTLYKYINIFEGQEVNLF